MKQIHKYTTEEANFIRDNINGCLCKDMAEKINKKFGLNLSYSQIKGYISNHHLKNGMGCTFKPGHIPANKGKKKWWVGGEATQFKPGHCPANYKPVGSERIDAKDGYTLIKVADPNKWKPKHIKIWEEAYGKIPKGMAVLFIDQNKKNITLENLRLVSRAQMAVVNKRRLLNDNAETNQSALALVDLIIKISSAEKRQRSKKNK